MSRGAMTMRADIERAPASSDDPWGRPGAPSFSPLATVPCRAWSRERREARDDGKTVVIEDIRALFPRDADVKSGDRATIKDRRGDVLFGGPLAVDAVARKAGPSSSASHLQAMLRRHK